MSEEPKMRDIGKQIREEAFSIPNLLSYFRLLLIPLFVLFTVSVFLRTYQPMPSMTGALRANSTW